MGLLLSLFVAAALAVWARNRIRSLEDRAASQDRRIAGLTERVFQLEASRRSDAAAAESLPLADPPPAVEPPPFVGAASPPPLSISASTPDSPPPKAPRRDLETMIGGNWLSKLGVLMLLTGIALFLGYSMTEMGPTGRILTGAATAVALLVAGIAAERREAYRVLGTALIGGGWAGLYFTAFAAHGIPAARVIESAGAGLLLLLGVAGGMILHSLRYRSQTVTGMAYMAAFLTIAISSLTQFSAVASIALLLSLLVVAWKYNWQMLAAAGAMFAYTAYGFDLATGDKDRYFIGIGEPVVWSYWLILEVFDLASKRRGGAPALGPLNLIGFLFATAAVWPRGGGWDPGQLLGTMGAAQLMSGVLRGRTPETVWGGYRASITFAALFTAAYVWDRFSGMQRGLLLALLAQSIAVSGWLLRSEYLRVLGAVLFVLPQTAAGTAEQRPVIWTMTALYGVNRIWLGGGLWYSLGVAGNLGLLLLTWERPDLRPVLLTIAACGLALILRVAGKPEARWVGVGLAVVSAAALTARMPEAMYGVTLGLPAVLYLAFGWAIPESWQRLATFALFQFFAGALCFRLTGQTPWLVGAWMTLAAASWAAGVLRGAPSLAGSALLPEGLALLFWAIDLWGHQNGIAAQATAAVALYLMFLVGPTAGDRYVRAAGALHGVMAAGMTTALLQDFVVGRRVTLAWGVEAIFLLGAGIGLQNRQLRWSGLALFALCAGKLFWYDFSALDTLSRILSFLVVGCLLLAASWAYSRFGGQIRRLL